MRSKVVTAVTLLCWSTLALAQEAKPPARAPAPDAAVSAPAPAPAAQPEPPKWYNQFVFALHGFVSASIYGQDGNAGPSEGQQALFANADTPASTVTTVTAGGAPSVRTTAPVTQPNTHRLDLGGDVRQSRFNFSVAGPKVFGDATPKAVLEIDFFGGFGSGAFGDVSLVPRLRWAYVELDYGWTRLLAGQNNDLIFTIAPVSLAHIAFPFGYGSGNIGWRRPAIFGYHTLGPKTGTNLEFAWEVGRSQWADTGSAVGTVTYNGIGQNTVNTTTGDKYGFNLGEASGLPAVEARVTVSHGSALSAFVTGHWNRVDRAGIDQAPTTTPAGISSRLDVLAMNAGGRAVVGPLTLAATGFVGKNLSPIIGNFLQFQGPTVGDVHEMGGWVQAGFNFTKELSLWGYIGVDKPNQQDAIAARFTRLSNVTGAALLQYRYGGYAVGFEWVHFRTRTRNYAGTTEVGSVNGAGQIVTTATSVSAAQAAEASGDRSTNQYLLSVNYFF